MLKTLYPVLHLLAARSGRAVSMFGSWLAGWLWKPTSLLPIHAAPPQGYLATRNTDEMLFRVFDSQWRIGCKYDWTEQSKRDLQSWGLKIDLKWVKSKSKFAFKNIIREKSREVAFNQLLEQKKKHSKLRSLHYDELQIQGYLKNPKISVRQAQIVFKSRCRMTVYWVNFKGWKLAKYCPVCKEPDELDTQHHSYRCKIITENVDIRGEITDVFNYVTVDTARTLENIELFRGQ